MDVRQELEELKEEKYRKFASSLIPGCEDMLGVRIPKLRILAKKIAKENPREFLYDTEETCFEERMLKGLVIAYKKAPFSETWEDITWFLPKITDWSVCDSLCCSLKQVEKHREEAWELLKPYRDSEETYTVRFYAVMLLNYYICADYLPFVFENLTKIKHPDYYVKMAVAWAYSVCFAKFPEETFSYLKACPLDEETFQKTLQKIRESNRVSPEWKKKIRTFPRLSACNKT